MQGGKAHCRLCPHRCVVPEGKRGLCLARINTDGAFYAEGFGRITSIALDPIGKKPLLHFHPGSLVLSLGSYGCNFRCAYCQNHGISTKEARWQALSPEQAAALSLEHAPRGNIGLAYTYNEPLVGYEYVRECAALIRGQNQLNVLVTNGYVNPEPLGALLPYIDAVNIDLKGFSHRFYQEIGGSLEPVKAAISACARACHVEVSALIVPGKNDGEEEMESMAKWLSCIDSAIPLHIARFFPRYKMGSLSPTPIQTLRSLSVIAEKHLQYVHLGNC